MTARAAQADQAQRVAAGLDNIDELIRRTTLEQGLPQVLEDPLVARRVAILLTTSLGASDAHESAA